MWAHRSSKKERKGGVKENTGDEKEFRSKGLWCGSITLPALRKILTSVSVKGDNSFDENNIS